MGQEESPLNIPPRKVVKTLAVGQEVEGVVKRVTDFGAFVDIGVGRDGLVHVSEMGTGRVTKPSDVVREGDKVRVWIKELDREKNRISLSMIAPGTLTMRDLEEGMIVTGKVTRLERYGAFVDIGVGREGMLHVKEMGHGYVQRPEDVVQVGQDLQVQVIGVDRRRGRIDLSIKELLPKPEEQQQPVVEKESPAAIAPEEFLPASEEDFISPFELAFQEATSGRRNQRRERRKKARSWEYFDEEEDIIERTLAHHRKNL
ncbi:MAG: S1 RNA-binding domain-containing protein [Anaerolineae bacterium]